MPTIPHSILKLSKTMPIIDEIDELLAKYYGFTEEEPDFIINYDIKYRMDDKLNEGGQRFQCGAKSVERNRKRMKLQSNLM